MPCHPAEVEGRAIIRLGKAESGPVPLWCLRISATAPAWSPPVTENSLPVGHGTVTLGKLPYPELQSACDPRLFGPRSAPKMQRPRCPVTSQRPRPRPPYSLNPCPELAPHCCLFSANNRDPDNLPQTGSSSPCAQRVTGLGTWGLH